MAVANGDAATGSAGNGSSDDDVAFKLKFCTVCASNQNRYCFEVPRGTICD